jgi:hypothetical protein
MYDALASTCFPARVSEAGERPSNKIQKFTDSQTRRVDDQRSFRVFYHQNSHELRFG